MSTAKGGVWSRGLFWGLSSFGLINVTGFNVRKKILIFFEIFGGFRHPFISNPHLYFPSRRFLVIVLVSFNQVPVSNKKRSSAAPPLCLSDASNASLQTSDPPPPLTPQTCVVVVVLVESPRDEEPQKLWALMS